MDIRRIGHIFISLICLLISVDCVHAEALKFVDALGVEVEFEHAPKRIVSMSPENTEILFALGLGDRVVGVTNYSDYPPQAAKKDTIGGFKTPNLEKIVSLEPDLVFATRGNPIPVLERLREFNINVFAVDPRSIGDMLSVLETMGKIAKVESRADSLVSVLKMRVNRITKALEGISGYQKQKVLWNVSAFDTSIYTAGPGTIMDDLITLSDGINMAGAARMAWPNFGLERILASDPDVIFTGYLGGNADESIEKRVEGIRAELRRIEGWKAVSAVKEGRVYYIDISIAGRAGPRLVDALEIMVGYMHPQLFER